MGSTVDVIIYVRDEQEIETAFVLEKVEGRLKF